MEKKKKTGVFQYLLLRLFRHSLVLVPSIAKRPHRVDVEGILLLADGLGALLDSRLLYLLIRPPAVLGQPLLLVSRLLLFA